VKRDNARMTLSLIAALDRNYAIGRGGLMPWHLPDDLKRFKQLTLGKPVLMGRKTALAIGRPLPGRRNLVLTRSTTAPFAGQETVASIAAAVDMAQGAELAVIGGGEVYELALPVATHLHLTWIETVAENPDAFFPHFDASAWIETGRIAHPADARHEYPFTFVDYVRRAGLGA
jgi:dihydrofolate reductase